MKSNIKPRYITNNAGAVVWKWENKNAYGLNPADENISGVPFEYNIRFAGQYFDKESGLHYNYHRMYNPMTGRYMQPDPIGVDGGMNIYSYVENNPLNAVDHYGLLTEVVVIIDKGGIDHAALRIDDKVINFHPINKMTSGIIKAKAAITTPTLSEFDSVYKKHTRHYLRVNLSKQEEVNILNLVELYKNKNIEYNLLRNQCVTYSLDLLSFGDIFETAYFPEDLIGKIKSNKKYISETIILPNKSYMDIK